ncbi:hypothetical protein GOV04_02090 [Candidatus Woesearchaeota archaeon]|nr:hypothetical protein [Candidatus Woesearchaeota archaeon]
MKTLWIFTFFSLIAAIIISICSFYVSVKLQETVGELADKNKAEQEHIILGLAQLVLILGLFILGIYFSVKLGSFKYVTITLGLIAASQIPSASHEDDQEAEQSLQPSRRSNKLHTVIYAAMGFFGAAVLLP